MASDVFVYILADICCWDYINYSFLEETAKANRYWSGELLGVLEETLLGGKIEVVEIIEDYT